MKTPDEEISNTVLDKLTPLKRWNKTTVNKIAAWVKDGNITASDLIFLLENQRTKNLEVIE
jgi:hypothetical protein